MTDFTPHKIEIFTGINDEPTAPTANSGQNISYNNDKHNDLLDELQTAFDSLESRLSQIENQIELANNTIDFIQADVDKLDPIADSFATLISRVEALEQTSSNPYQFTVDITTTDTELITIEEPIALSAILATGYTDVYGFGFRLNGEYLDIGVPNETDGIAEMGFDPIQQLSVGDTISVYSFDGDMPGVTITFVLAQ